MLILIYYALGQKENIDLEELDLMYVRTIEELGEDYTTVLLLNNYAYFKSFFNV